MAPEFHCPVVTSEWLLHANVSRALKRMPSRSTVRFAALIRTPTKATTIIDVISVLELLVGTRSVDGGVLQMASTSAKSILPISQYISSPSLTKSCVPYSHAARAASNPPKESAASIIFDCRPCSWSPHSFHHALWSSTEV